MACFISVKYQVYILKKGKCNSNNLNPNAILNPKIIIIIERLIKEERLRARLVHVFKHMFSVFK